VTGPLLGAGHQTSLGTAKATTPAASTPGSMISTEINSPSESCGPSTLIGL
jgi:hypothetical protein